MTDLGFGISGAVAPPLPPEASDPLIGTTVAGRFQVTARIGHGGMGIVYRATHAVIKREVALKVLHERHVERKEVAARLVNEARLASAIRNEHIVDIFDSGETPDGRTFVVMELLGGESLAAVIRRDGALAEKRAIQIVLQIAEALGAAHERGIIHRDVKPENIFLSTRDGEEFVKVLDFGISKAVRGGDLENDERLTHTGVVLGTPLYMSPEQGRGEERIDHRIDVYALGVILYECLTGETPFRGSNYLGVISDVLSRVPSPPRQVRPDLRISLGIEQVVARAMAKDLASRYASMRELAADLSRVLAGEPLSNAPVASAPTSVPPSVRRRKALMFSAIGGVAITAIVATALLGRPSVTPAVAPAAAAPAQDRAPEPPPPAKSDVGPATSAPVPSPPAPSPLVALDVRSTPPGAEIWNGAERIGVAPQLLHVQRSQRVQLRLHLDGYADHVADLTPVDNDHLEVALRPLPRRPSHRAKSRPAEGKSGQEMLPVSRWPGDHK